MDPQINQTFTHTQSYCQTLSVTSHFHVYSVTKQIQRKSIGCPSIFHQSSVKCLNKYFCICTLYDPKMTRGKSEVILQVNGVFT